MFSHLRWSVNKWCRGRYLVPFQIWYPYKCKATPVCSKKPHTTPKSFWNPTRVYKCPRKMALPSVSKPPCIWSLVPDPVAWGRCCQRSWLGSLEPGREWLHFIFSSLPLASAAAAFQKGRLNELGGRGDIQANLGNMLWLIQELEIAEKPFYFFFLKSRVLL